MMEGVRGFLPGWLKPPVGEFWGMLGVT